MNLSMRGIFYRGGGISIDKILIIGSQICLWIYTDQSYQGVKVLIFLPSRIVDRTKPQMPV